MKLRDNLLWCKRGKRIDELDRKRDVLLVIQLIEAEEEERLLLPQREDGSKDRLFSGSMVNDALGF